MELDIQLEAACRRPQFDSSSSSIYMRNQYWSLLANEALLKDCHEAVGGHIQCNPLAFTTIYATLYTIGSRCVTALGPILIPRQLISAVLLQYHLRNCCGARKRTIHCSTHLDLR